MKTSFKMTAFEKDLRSMSLGALYVSDCHLSKSTARVYRHRLKENKNISIKVMLSLLNSIGITFNVPTVFKGCLPHENQYLFKNIIKKKNT